MVKHAFKQAGNILYTKKQLRPEAVTVVFMCKKLKWFYYNLCNFCR